VYGIHSSNVAQTGATASRLEVAHADPSELFISSQGHQISLPSVITKELSATTLHR
jgi:hypothetical protein